MSSIECQESLHSLARRATIGPPTRRARAPHESSRKPFPLFAQESIGLYLCTHAIFYSVLLPSHLLPSLFFSLSLLVVTQIRGHIASFPPPPLHHGSCLGRHFYRENISAISSLVDSRRNIHESNRKRSSAARFLPHNNANPPASKYTPAPTSFAFVIHPNFLVHLCSSGAGGEGGRRFVRADQPSRGQT